MQNTIAMSGIARGKGRIPSFETTSHERSAVATPASPASASKNSSAPIRAARRDISLQPRRTDWSSARRTSCCGSSISRPRRGSAVIADGFS